MAYSISLGFPGGSVVKKPPTNEVDMSWIPGVGNGNPLQYSCLENSMGRGAWRAAKESDLT